MAHAIEPVAPPIESRRTMVPALESSPLPKVGFWRRHGFKLAVGLLAAAALPFTLSHGVTQPVGSATPAADDLVGRRIVRIARPGHAETVTLKLPANIDAFQTTLLYARVSGYLVRWHADIGDRVRKDQALAEIDTPEMDQDLRQAKANLVQGRADLATAKAELDEAQAALQQATADIAHAQANLECAGTLLKRNDKLLGLHAIAAQELDESHRDNEMRRAELASATATYHTRESAIATATAKIRSKEASVSSLEACVSRLEKLQEFKTIRAPFDGIVTRRRAEVGMLVAAGNAATQELFAVGQGDVLRIRINVPQAQARSIEIGQKAQVLVDEYPDHVFTAQVARTSRALDPASRTLMVELELPNHDGRLLSGTYGQVLLTVRRPENTFTVPVGVLLNRPDGLKLAVVDERNAVRLQDVKLGRDYGSRVEVVCGLQGNEMLILNPPDDLLDGERVTLAPSPDNPSPPVPPATAGRPLPSRT